MGGDNPPTRSLRVVTPVTPLPTAPARRSLDELKLSLYGRPQARKAIARPYNGKMALRARNESLEMSRSSVWPLLGYRSVPRLRFAVREGRSPGAFRGVRRCRQDPRCWAWGVAETVQVLHLQVSGGWLGRIPRLTLLVHALSPESAVQWVTGTGTTAALATPFAKL
eukprot:scaffold3761_cov372-Prasinococcus_capsulatus_cf.AAC.23